LNTFAKNLVALVVLTAVTLGGGLYAAHLSSDTHHHAVVAGGDDHDFGF